MSLCIMQGHVFVRNIQEKSMKFNFGYTFKHVLSGHSGHSKKDKIKVLKTGGILIQVKSIAECSPGAFCNTFDLH